MNQCADELLLNLADRDQVLSGSFFVKDPQNSWDAHLAENIPANSGRIEEITAFAPDLVLTGDFSSRSTVALLHDLDFRVVEVAHPRSIAEIRQQIHRVAGILGHPERGQALVARMDETISAHARPSPRSVAVYQPNGFTVGAGSLVNEIIEAAGLRNVAAAGAMSGYAHYPLEMLLYDRPELLIVDRQMEDTRSLAHELLRHPALRSAFGGLRMVSMPPQAWACGSHHVGRAVQILARAAYE